MFLHSCLACNEAFIFIYLLMGRNESGMSRTSVSMFAVVPVMLLSAPGRLRPGSWSADIWHRDLDIEGLYQQILELLP